VEAAIDDIVTYDAATSISNVPPGSPGNRLAFGPARPNPARGRVRLRLVLPRTAEAEVDVVALAGRRVRNLYRGHAAAGSRDLAWDGRDDAGRAAPAGLYYA